MTRAAVFVSRHFVMFALLAYCAGAAERIAEAVLSEGPIWELRANNLTQYFVNYAEHGFARRALIGTVLHPWLSALDSPELASFWLMVAMNVAGAAALLALVQRLLPHSEEATIAVALRAAFAIGSAGIIQIAHDYGRFDLPNVLVLAAALWLLARGRLALASVVCAMGILIHEAFAIYGAPLVVALAWAAAPAGRGVLRAAGVALLPGAAALALLLHGGSDSAARLTIGSGAYVWRRGLIEIGWGLPWPQVAVLVACWAALGALLTWFCRGNDRRPDLLVLAALAPIALNLFGIDHGRWLTIGFMVASIAMILQVHLFGCRWPRLSPRQMWLAALLIVPLGPHGLTGAWTWWM